MGYYGDLFEVSARTLDQEARLLLDLRKLAVKIEDSSGSSAIVSGLDALDRIKLEKEGYRVERHFL
jgi:hypothetical protein